MIYIKAKFTFISLVLLFLSFQTVLAVEIITTIDRNPVNINDSFQITFTATESPDKDPDFSPLEEDFEMLNISQSDQSTAINWKATRSIQWVLKVKAKRTGTLNIPTIFFGEDTSQPVSLIVNNNTKPNNIDNNNNEDIFLEVEATPKTPYVQAQVIYTLRLFRKVNLAQARLTEPEMADAVVEKLGEDKTYNTRRNGVAYTVTERKYAIFPQKSGVATIKPLQLTAEVISSSRTRFNGFFTRQATETKRVMSKEITLNVQAVADDFSGKHWIPAEHLYIEEKWSGDTALMNLGEPLTRTLTLLSKATTVAQLPELHSGIEIAQLKTYPDQPLLKEKKSADGLIALREEKIAYIPSKSGTFTIPAIEIPWFNTKTGKMEMARIAEKTITATASSEPTSPAIGVPIQTDVATSKIIQQIEPENKFWMWLSLILASGWLITTVFLLRKLIPKKQEIVIDKKEIKLKETVKALKQACAENNQLAAKDALLSWGKIKFNNSSLMETASQCEARLRDQIQLLNQSLYANNAEPWQGKKLFQYFVENSAREKIAKKTNDGLEPLYRL